MQGHVAIDQFALPRKNPPVVLEKLRPTPDAAILEVVLLPLLVPFVAWLMGRQDLFFLETAFPWMLLVPTLTASRYGSRYGLLSLLVMSSLSLLYVLVYQPALLTTVSQILVGSLLVVLVIGEMIQYWGKRTTQQAEEVEKYRQSASQSEQALQLLHISYSQLEEDLVSVNQSLASSLRLLDTSINQAQTPEGTDSGRAIKIAVQKMQEILKQYSWLEAAAFYRVNSSGKLHAKDIGSIGSMKPGMHQDPLVKEALRCKQAVSIKHDQLMQNRQLNTNLHAAIPLLDSKGTVWGVMAVAKMAPASLTQQNLNLLALLCNYVANLLDNSKRPATSAKLLLQEMYTALNVVLNTVKTATLITMEVKSSAETDEYKDYFVNKVRGANRIWSLQRNGSATLIMLLPMFNSQDYEQFESSLSSTFKKRFGKELPEAGITMTFNHIRHQMPRSALQNYLVSLGKFDNARLIR